MVKDGSGIFTNPNNGAFGVDDVGPDFGTC